MMLSWGNCRRVLSFLVVLTLTTAPVTTWADESCAKLINAGTTSDAEARAKALQAASRFQAFFKAVETQLLERSYLVDLSALALIAREHLLLMGPPGNAKSMLADAILGNVLEHEAKADVAAKRSYYRIQMTPETTMSETHGPLDFKTLNDTGRYERIYSEGMLESRLVFIDEIFDGRANAMRNILGLLAERAHAQGPRVITGRIETVIAATNKFIGEVYEKAGDDGPKALLDRFAISAFVPGEFENVQSYVQLIQMAKKDGKAIPALTFSDLDSIRALVKQVEIPVHVAKALSLLSYKIKEETESMEQASLKSYREKLKSGEEAGVPYRATKYHSPRTLAKAAGMLKSIVVYEWLKSGGKRSLEARLDDLARLEVFFTLNGPNDAFVQKQIERSSNPHERSQLTAIVQERQVFRRHFVEVMKAINAVTAHYGLAHVQSALDAAQTPEAKRALLESLIPKLGQLHADAIVPQHQSDLNGKVIGEVMVRNYLEEILKDGYGADYDRLVGERLAHLANEREAKALVEQRRLAAEMATKTAAESEAKRIEQAYRAEAERRSAGLKSFGAKLGPEGEGTSYVRTTYPFADPRSTLWRAVANSRGEVLVITQEGTKFELLVLQSGGGTHKIELGPSSDLVLAEAFSAPALAFTAANELVYATPHEVVAINIHSRAIVASQPLTGRKDAVVGISADGTQVFAIDGRLGQLVQVDWSIGVRKTTALKSAATNAPDFNMQMAVRTFESNQAVIRASAGGDKLNLTAKHGHEQYRVAVETGEVDYVGTTPAAESGSSAVGWSYDGSRAYFAKVNGEPPEALLTEIDFVNPQRNRTQKVTVSGSGVPRLSIVGDGAFVAFSRDGQKIGLATTFDGDAVNLNSFSGHPTYGGNVVEAAPGVIVFTSHNGSAFEINVIRLKR